MALLTQTDLSASGGGLFGYSRSYSNPPTPTTPPYLGINGYNWYVSTLPYAVRIDGTTVDIIFNQNKAYTFYQYGSTYTAQYPWLNVSLTEDATTHLFTFTDTSNGRLQVLVLNSLAATTAPGAFVSYTDANGIQTAVTSRSGTQINEVQRSYVIGGTTTVDSMLYNYNSSGSAVGLLQSVSWRQQVGGGSWTPMRQCVYVYYGSGNGNGSVNDLQSASQQLPDGLGGWKTVAVDYYIYWLSGSSTGFAHALKIHIGPESFRQAFNASVDLSTAPESTLLQYADQYFEYSPTGGQVTKEIAAVCSSCAGGGTTSDLFTYSTNPRSPASGYGTWSNKTVQTLPDGSQIIVYTNDSGLPILMVNIAPSPLSANMWGTFYRYNSAGQMIWKAHPSAVALPSSLSTLEAYDDLLNYDSGTGLYQYLNNTSGLIEISDYFTSTNPSTGAVQGYLADTQVQQGQNTTPVMTQSYTYASNTASGNTVYPTATLVSYPIAANTTTKITTSYLCTYFTGTNQLQTKTTTLPIVSSTTQNGSNTAYTTLEQYDSAGNLIQTTDERGTVNTYTYSALGLLSEQVLNYQSGGATTPGVNVTSDYTYDYLGRLIQTLGPSHTVVLSGTATTVRKATYYVYIQSAQPGSGTWGPDQTMTGQGYATGSGSYTYYLVNPVSITNADKDGRTTDQITSARSTGSGALSPTDTFVQTDWQSWTNIQYDSQHRTTGQSVYFLIPSSGSGTVGTNYGQTTFGYDSLERRNRVEAPGGTITRTVWTTPQWVASVWVGTDDFGATDSDPSNGGAGGNNMVMVTSNVYDFGSAGGDGNLTQQTQYAPGTRVTNFGYDFRDRRISTTDATNRYFLTTYDNLSRQTAAQSYVTSTGNLFAQSKTYYDDRSRVYRTETYAVDSSGTLGNILTSNSWYDPSGNLLQQIGEGAGQVFSKNVYNRVNWVMSRYFGYNPSGTSYTQATTVSGDIIVEQTDNTYDEVGNLISATMSQRWNGDSTTTGSLTSSFARVSYTASWFDGIDRVIASANYGTASSSRPGTPPASSSSVLVTLTSYNNGGEASQMTDPMGYVMQTSYDDAGRRTTVIEAYGSASARTTNWTYTPDNLVATMTAMNSITGNQTTTWTYGTDASSSSVVRNDLLASVTYPDSVSGSDVVSYAYNRLGQQRTTTDQRGSIRTFFYDLLGRLTNDCVTTVGANTDATVLQIIRTYEIRGMVSTITSTDNAAQGAGTVLNQVQFTYNTLGQLIEDDQSHAGVVASGTPNVQYAYDPGASSSNEIRFNQLTYPNGRNVSYNFASGMDSTLNRVTSISDTGATLASYTYLGAGTFIQISYPQPTIRLDLWGGTSGVFTGLDQFGRIINQPWSNYSTSTTLDQYQYGYDLNSNRQWKRNVVGDAAVATGLDEFYTYDPLNRLTAMQRGVLNSSTAPTGITGTPSVEQDWTLDPVGNWSNFTTLAGTTTTLDQTRSTNTVNEITNVTATTGTDWVIPAYDKAGNTVIMPQAADPTQKFTAIYDAWNRMVSISTAAGGGGGSGGSGSSGSSSGSASSSSSPPSLVAQYQYDGRNFRIVKQTYTSGTLSEARHFYFTVGWQDIEEQVGGSMVDQYVWGLRYIDELVCRDDATPQRLYATQDANFNLTSIGDTSGSVVERYLFDPYGNRTIMNGSWSVIGSSGYDWDIGFQGLTDEQETGLIYVRNRCLNTLLGSWTTRDPSMYVDGSNVYLYVESAPTDATDPLGLAGTYGHGRPSVPVAPPCTPWVPAGQPELDRNLFEFQDWIPNTFRAGSFWAWFLGSLGGHHEQAKSAFQIGTTYESELELSITTGKSPLPDEPPGTDEGTLLSLTISNDTWSNPTHDFLQQVGIQGKSLLGVNCREFYAWRINCKRCCTDAKGNKRFETTGRQILAGPNSDGWVAGILRRDRWSPLGVYCDVQWASASAPSAASICSGGDELSGGTWEKVT
jgi:RHS repeat-associated protein